MSWQEVTPVIGGVAGTMKRLVRFRISKKFGAAVTVPASVMETCQWKAGDKLKVLIGGGDHAGKLRFTKSADGLLTLRATKGDDTFQINVGRLPQLPEREVERVAVEHQADVSGLEIRLPAHAQLIEPAPRAATPPGPGQKINVVDKVVGGGPQPPRFAPQSGTRGR